MGGASYLVGKEVGWTSRPMAVYAAQLLLNLAWQPIFFLLKKPGVAQVENAGGVSGSACVCVVCMCVCVCANWCLFVCLSVCHLSPKHSMCSLQAGD